jgi:hypothetical protein
MKNGECPVCKTQLHGRQKFCSHSCAAKAYIAFHDDPIERCKYFLTKTVLTSSGCMEWQGARNQQGYGRAGINKKLWTIPRAIYTYLIGGSIPKGMFVCHSCDNPPCINPEHLWLGTRQENNADSVKKGRWPGARNLIGNRPWEKLRQINNQTTIEGGI